MPLHDTPHNNSPQCPNGIIIMNLPKLQNFIPRLSWILLPVACLSFSTAVFAQDDGIEEIIVYGISTGSKASIAAQRESKLFVSIVSEEELDSLPDQNLADVLSRIPGVGISRDRGEADEVYIRGTDARLNAVTINGDRLPSPESTTGGSGQRTASMTTIPASLINQIEVYKSVPPSMDGDSMGGAVIFRTKTATDLDGPLVRSTVRYGNNELASNNLFSGEFTFGNRLNDAGTWGVIVTLTYEQNNRSGSLGKRPT